MPLASVLIANRGEIACRIMRSAKRMGIRTIAVYSHADRDALHVRLADEAHCIGPPPARESYLSIESIIATARASDAECVHPGCGFLSENADFAQACEQAGLIFIGPSSAAIRAMGLKSSAKTIMQNVGVPIVPGYHGVRQDFDFLAEQAEQIGYPVLIKAAAGGGGKGIRRVEQAAAFAQALEDARREARAAFGDDRVLVEKYIANPRHIEMQIIADAYGDVLHLFERDCSLQRRYQKVIEEAPAPGLGAAARAAMSAAALRAARAVSYVGAGTVEFIADATHGLRPDAFWFMEMNTRLQVEHPVSEAILGLDLVDLQFRIAAGERIPFSQEDVRVQGHAIEARLYAEDPAHGFLPSSGRLLALRFPEGEGLRVDNGVDQGAEVTPFYDAMIAKIIAHGRTREEALDRLDAALAQTLVVGPRCNAKFLASLVQSQTFRQARMDTGFIDRHFADVKSPEPDAVAIAAGLAALIAAACASRRESGSPDDPWSAANAFQLGPERCTPVEIEADGQLYGASWSLDGDAQRIALTALDFAARVATPWNDALGFKTIFGEPDTAVIVNGGRSFVWRENRQTEVRLLDGFDIASLAAGEDESLVKAPMPGKLVALFVREGERVEKGQRVALVEAMKMEHALLAPRSGAIVSLRAAAGDQVALHHTIAVIAETISP